MSMEPETDNRREPGLATPGELAAWALLGDDTARVPVTLVSIYARVAQAIRQAVQAARADQKEKDARLLDGLDPFRSDGLVMEATDFAAAIRNQPT